MIAIIDCNSFYASCEKVFRPDLEGKPIVVLSNNDGCLIARNDEAKAVGIAMGVPFFKVKDIIEEKKIFVASSNYALYGDLSRRVMETISEINPWIQVYSIDEAFIDVSHIPIAQMVDYCQHIQQIILKQTGIPVSIGVASTKVLSKVANRVAKRTKALCKGVFVLATPTEEQAALQDFPVEDVWGIGRQQTKKLRLLGIGTAYQLSQKSTAWAKTQLGGVVGVRLIKELNGISCIELGEGLESKKMIASTRSFGQPVTTLEEMKEAIATYTCRAAEKLRIQQSNAAYLSIFMKTNRFDQRAAYRSEGAGALLPFATNVSHLLIKEAVRLAESCFETGLSYKKAGVLLSMITPANQVQSSLFDTLEIDSKTALLQKTLDRINQKNGLDTIKYAATGTTRNWKMRAEERSPEHTTKWSDVYKLGKDVPRGTNKKDKH